MPMPKPRKRESRDDFMSRCHTALVSEFDDASQRNAVCAEQWRSRDKETHMKTKQRNRHQPGVVATKGSNGLIRLNVPLSVKAETIDQAERTFEGLAATWDEDLGQDIIHKGAFKDSIASWKDSGEAMPLLNSHDHFDIFAALGQAVSMKETPEGLWTKWEVLEGEDGDRVLQRLRPSKTTGRAIIGKMSIGFYAMKYDYEQPEGTESFFDRKRHIYKADLREVSLVLFPMNPGASIDSSTVKMWLKAAHDTDPRQLDSVTRMELRRLNSRIGLLLKKQKPQEGDEQEEQDSEEEQLPPTTPDPSTPPTDEEERTDDGSDDEADDTEQQQEVKEEEKKEEVKPYIYSEALLQRLEKVRLKHKISDVTVPK